jgi:hypothetical protein
MSSENSNKNHPTVLQHGDRKSMKMDTAVLTPDPSSCHSIDRPVLQHGPGHVVASFPTGLCFFAGTSGIGMAVWQNRQCSPSAGFSSLSVTLFPVCCFPVAFAQHDRKWFK